MSMRHLRTRVAILSAIVSLSPLRAKADFTPSHLNDVQYNWPNPYPTANFTLETTFTVWDDPGINTSLYFSHYFSLGPYTGDPNQVTLYFGLQTNGGTTRSVIFSLWNATDGNGTNCAPFGNEGVGYHCLVEYPWIAGRGYTMAVSRLAGSQNDTYTGTVTDDVTNIETTLGTLTGPHTDARPGTSIFFYEYYSSIASCAALPNVSMSFSNIQGEQGTVTPTYVPGAYGYEGSCSNNIESTICGNTIYNVVGGAVSRPNGMNTFTVGTDCRPSLPLQTPSASPSPASTSPAVTPHKSSGCSAAYSPFLGCAIALWVLVRKRRR